MNKKRLLIEVIKKLKWSRELADGILALLENADIDNKTIDGLIRILAISIKNVKWEREKANVEKSLKQLRKIKEIEAIEKESEEDIERILDDI